MSPSIFDADCPTCGAPLLASNAWEWRCARCDVLFERCGRFLVMLRPPAGQAAQHREIVRSDR
jgi:hypothetical protein